MSPEPGGPRLRIPSRREASRRRLRARLDEHVGMLRVLEARVRRRSAEATIRAIDVLELTWLRLEDTRRSGAARLARLRAQAARLLSGRGGR